MLSISKERVLRTSLDGTKEGQNNNQVGEMEMIDKQDLYAIQIDLFDNRGAETKHRSDVAVRGRIETNQTHGRWFEISGQMQNGRKPSQTRRHLAEERDYEILEELIKYREELQLENTKGWDFKPTISTFYPKGQKKLGNIPTFMAVVSRERGGDWKITINLGNWCGQYTLEDKGSKTHKVFFHNERFVFNNQVGREKYGF